MRHVTISGSSSIASFGYEPATETLTVHFVSGRVHHYSAVPAEVVDAFEASSSAGKFFNFNVRNKYTEVK